MGGEITNIPRIYTALAEWCACMVCCMAVRREKPGKRELLIAGGFLIWLCVFLEVTEDVTIFFWIPCMLAAVGSMLLMIYLICDVAWAIAAYCCAQAFLLAEFAASFEWQIEHFLPYLGLGSWYFRLAVFLLVFGVTFGAAWRLERTLMGGEFLLQISGKELLSAILIAAAAFALSNISFIYRNTPFSARFTEDIFHIRTVVDLGGLAVLFAFQSRIHELHTERELISIQNMLKSQYERYRNYQESIDMIHVKCHDLKHQIAAFRAELNTQKKEEWLNTMEQGLAIPELESQTGNAVLDTVLTGKKLYCSNHQIELTCVVDGELLNFLHVIDICTIFGNALDNAIESVILVEDCEKRLIHLTVSAKKGFVFIHVANYCEQEELKLKEKYPMTSKKDKENHGYGLKSIRYSVEKYGGTMNFGVEQHWFELKILIPGQ